MKKVKKEVCPLCESEFIPRRGQKMAWWCIDWCTKSKGKLCFDCYEAAVELGGISDSDESPIDPPWGSDIVKLSKSTTEKQYRKQRYSERLILED